MAKRQFKRFGGGSGCGIEMLASQSAVAAVASPVSISFSSECAPAEVINSQPKARVAPSKGVDMSEAKAGTHASPLPSEAKASVELLMSEVRYCVAYGELNERFNAAAFRTVEVVKQLGLVIGGAGLGGGAFVSSIKNLQEVIPPSVLFALGSLFGVIGVAAYIAQKVWKFDAAEKQFRETRAKFEKLLGKGWQLSAEELSERLGELRSSAPLGLNVLSDAAYNKTVMQLGHVEAKVPISFFVRLLPGVPA